MVLIRCKKLYTLTWNYLCLIIILISCCSWGSQGKNAEELCIPFSSGPHFVRTLHHDPSVLGGLHGMAHSFIQLDKVVSHVISLVSFL